MGSVYSIECECGYSLSVSQGVGMFYPRQCSSIMQSILEGDYGEEMKKAAETVPHAAPTAGIIQVTSIWLSALP